MGLQHQVQRHVLYDENKYNICTGSIFFLLSRNLQILIWTWVTMATTEASMHLSDVSRNINKDINHGFVDPFSVRLCSFIHILQFSQHCGFTGMKNVGTRLSGSPSGHTLKMCNTIRSRKYKNWDPRVWRSWSSTGSKTGTEYRLRSSCSVPKYWRSVNERKCDERQQKTWNTGKIKARYVTCRGKIDRPLCCCICIWLIHTRHISDRIICNSKYTPPLILSVSVPSLCRTKPSWLFCLCSDAVNYKWLILQPIKQVQKV